MVYVALGARLLLGGVFAVAAFSKIRSRKAFRDFVEWLTDFPFASRFEARGLAATVLTIEFMIVALLALPVTVLAGFVLGTCLLVLFFVETVVAIRRGVRTPCRCFGVSKTSLSGAHVIRDILLVGVAFAGVAFHIMAPAATDIAPTGVLLAVAGACVSGALVLFFEDVYALAKTD